ncbi:MAG TPA: EF-hand domain-containing protein [Gammaproteobacteria bacterium]|nr:EF-hand domain-containing protein [Gammaproteobacteria bacterium]
MKKTVMLASTLVLLAGARVGWTQQFQGPNFDQLDKDKNGSLSKEEVADFFKQFAGRGNGGGGPNADQVFSRWDANGDGSVSKEEFDNRPRRGGQGGQGGQGRGQGGGQGN